MRRIAAITSLAVLVLTGSPADALTPLLEVSQQTVPFGTTQVLVSIVGTPLDFFIVGRSSSNSGLVVGGVSLQLGPDTSIVASGQLDAQGFGSFPLSLSPGPSTVHIQAVTASDAGFASFVPSPGKTMTVLGDFATATVVGDLVVRSNAILVNVPASGLVNVSPAALGLPANTATRNPVALRASAWTGTPTTVTLLMLASVAPFNGTVWQVRVYDPTGTFTSGPAVVELVVRLDP